MRTRQCSLLMPFACGMILAWAILASIWSWWPRFWFPFLASTAILYVVCRCLTVRPIAAGLVAALPSLAVPAFLWFLVLYDWHQVETARESGGLYTIFTMGDPHALTTIAQFIVLPTTLVLGAGLLAGIAAALVNDRENRNAANHTVHDSLTSSAS